MAYTARDLKDIAAHFDRRGDYAESAKANAVSASEARALERETRIWREAADFLRNTILTEAAS